MKPHPYHTFWLILGLTLAFNPESYAQPDINSPGYALRFYGNGINDYDRVKIRIDDPSTDEAGPPVDVGEDDMTLEFWMKAQPGENDRGSLACGSENFWIGGHLIFDRDRFNQPRAYGLSLADGRLMWGVDGESANRTICSTSVVDDGAWHHVAVQRRRSDGLMWIFIDGTLEIAQEGPQGDISYPDDGVPGNFCGGPCINSDPFLVIGAEKHDAGPSYPAYSGWIDEVRISNTIRYSDDFERPTSPLTTDEFTVALYRFDAGGGDIIFDSSEAIGGPSNGERKAGGTPAGPEWVISDAPIGTPLPVELTSFEAVFENTSMRLFWETASETNNAGFEIQRAPSHQGTADSWNALGFVKGQGTTTEPHTYMYLDEGFDPGVQTWFYRLKQVDFDGHFEYSNIVRVTLPSPQRIALSQNYPNPFNPTTSISYAIPVDSDVELKIFDVLGRNVDTLVDTFQPAGHFTIPFDGSELPGGMYIYRLRVGTSVHSSVMTLMK